MKDWSQKKSIQNVFKRAGDVCGGIAGLIVLSPLFLLAALLIKRESQGSVFFRYERIGFHEKPFKPFKFRTMTTGAIESGLGYTVSADDARITKTGRVLRILGIDELPQLLNIVKGEMSLVGPRPTFRYQVEKYTDFQKRRLEAKPGLTGWALIHGRNQLTWEERIQYDVWYVDNWSLWLDVKILLITPFIIFSGKGLYGKGGVNDPFL